MSLETKVPPIPLAVVEYLERMFPDKSCGVNDSIDVIKFKAGQVAVHRHLRAKYDDQTKHFTL